jgi:hypothetical protein
MSKRAIQTNEKVCLPRCVLKRIKRPKRPERKECPIGGLQTPNEQAVNAYIVAASRGIRTNVQRRMTDFIDDGCAVHPAIRRRARESRQSVRLA